MSAHGAVLRRKTLSRVWRAVARPACLVGAVFAPFAPVHGAKPALQPGSMQRLTIISAALHAPISYRLLVTANPPTGQPLDLLLLLHGANAHDDQWDDVAIDDALLARAKAGTMRPTLLVLPDGDAPTPATAATSPFVTFLLDELLPHIATQFDVSRVASHRAIGGISRGGGWALTIAALHPELFGVVGGHSAVTPTGKTAETMANTYARARTRVWLDIGDSDGLLSFNQNFARTLRAAKVDVTFALHQGNHDRTYWRAQSPQYAAFYAQALAHGPA